MEVTVRPPRCQERTRRAAAVALALAAITSGPLAALSSARTDPGVSADLSNLTTLSRWAYAEQAAPAHEFPSARSPVVGYLRFLTPEGQEEPYLAMRSYRTARHEWILVPIPGRPNGVTGWVLAGDLQEMQVTHEHLRVDRETQQATLYRGTEVIWTAPVGVGRPALPTPAGHFYVLEKLISESPVYGPYALGTSAYAPTLAEWPGGGQVGVHGTDEPQLIPGRPSHGCIRVRNADMVRLWHLIGVGTPIEIV